MKTKYKIVISIFALILCMVFFSSCDDLGSSDLLEVKDVMVDDDGNVIVKYENGTKSVIYKAKSIVSTELDENMHLIVTYSDGTVEDKGYAGPPACTVTFADYDGTVIATMQTYAGLRIEPPVDPQREDYIFAGWDTDISKITGDTTVTATYAPKESFTVVFRDHEGKILKSESVISGKSATAPIPPARADYRFVGWDRPFDVVTENMDVIATYLPKDSYRVTFADYNGLILDTVTVKEGDTAKTAVIPFREGYTFTGWSGSLLSISANKTVTAQYTLNEADNVFDISYKVSGNTVTLTLSLAGRVCVAGFEGPLAFEGMQAQSVTVLSPNAMANLKEDGTVYVAYTSATNVTKAEAVMTVTLKKTADTAKATLDLKECFCANDSFALENVAYTVIGQNIKLK